MVFVVLEPTFILSMFAKHFGCIFLSAALNTDSRKKHQQKNSFGNSW